MSSKYTQKEAVYSAIVSVLKENNIEFTEGMNVETVMTREIRAQVNSILVEGFNEGTVELDKTFSDKELKGYVSGLQSNWIRKDKRLNGGIKYVAKNPGSRVGSADPTLKAMRNLLATLTSAEDQAEVQEHIDARLAEIAASKAKKVTIDVSALPEALRNKFSI